MEPRYLGQKNRRTEEGSNKPGRRIGANQQKLVGGFNPFETYVRQIGSFPQVGMQIIIHWNHYLEKKQRPLLASVFLFSLSSKVAWSSFFLTTP